MAKTEQVRTLLEPLVDAADARIYDVTMAGGKLVVALTRDGGIDLETLAQISRELGRLLDEKDLVGGSYTLEVTSPGLERNLRTPEHFAGAIGTEITARTKPDVEGERRIKGVLRASDATSITIDVDDGEQRILALDDIERARTVFSWGPAAKPASTKKARP